MGRIVNPIPLPAQGGREISVSFPADFAQLFWFRRRGIVAILLGAGILGLVAALFWPPKYRVVSTFIPEQTTASSRLSAGLGGIAGQLGLSVTSDPLQSGRFYAEILLSRRVVEQVLRGRYLTDRREHVAADSVSLLDILQIQGDDSLERLRKGVDRLRAAVTVDADIRTNIVTITVMASNPTLAAAIANRFVNTVNEFNTLARQSQAGRRRRFIEQQSDSAERELRTAEDRLKSFYLQNRSWAESPELEYRRGQLQRQVEIAQDLYLALRRNLESARIDEVNDVPLVSVIDVAVPSRERRPSRRLIVFASLLLGGVVSIMYAYAGWYLDRSRRFELPESHE